MKKAIYLIAATALMASCNQEVLVDTHDPMPEAPRRIGFESFVNKSTRARGTNSTDLQDFYTSFNVYGWKTVGGTTTCVFKNIVVSYYDGVDTKPSEEWGADAPAGWYYDDIRYWDKMAESYQFSAYAPAGAAAVACEANGLITIGTAEKPITVESTNLMATPAKELAYTGFDCDYMTAQSKETLDKVSLTFKHLLAKLNIRIRLNASVTTVQDVAVQKIAVHNLGDKASYTNAEGEGVTGWTLSTASADYVPAIASTDELVYALNGTTNYHNYYVMEQLIIPQTIDNAATTAPSLAELPEACIYVEYTIGEETFKSYTPLASIFNSSAETYTFKGGNQYTINITVGPAPIEFTAKVTPWADAVEKELNMN